MSIKIIDADDLGKDGVRVTVDLDGDKDADANDSGRILVLTYGSYESSKNGAETKPQYIQRIKGEVKAMAREAAGKRAPAANKVASLVGADIT